MWNSARRPGSSGSASARPGRGGDQTPCGVRKVIGGASARTGETGTGTAFDRKVGWISDFWSRSNLAKPKASSFSIAIRSAPVCRLSASWAIHMSKSTDDRSYSIIRHIAPGRRDRQPRNVPGCEGALAAHPCCPGVRRQGSTRQAGGVVRAATATPPAAARAAMPPRRPRRPGAMRATSDASVGLVLMFVALGMDLPLCSG